MTVPVTLIMEKQRGKPPTTTYDMINNKKAFEPRMALNNPTTEEIGTGSMGVLLGNLPLTIPISPLPALAPQSHPSFCFVSPQFRNAYFDWLSSKGIQYKSKHDDKLLRFSAYLLPFSASIVYSVFDDMDVIIVSGDWFKNVVEPGLTGHNLSISSVLADFRSRYWGIEVKPAKYCSFNQHVNVATRVVSQSIPQALKTLIDAELQSNTTDLVDLVTGLPLADCKQKLDLPVSPVAQVAAIQERLNNLDAGSFADMIPHINNAVKKIDNLAKKKASRTNVYRQRTMKAILMLFRVNPVPAYRSVGGTSRLYATRHSFLNLDRTVRDVLTQSYWKLDLNAAQLRISCALWGAAFPVDQAQQVWPYFLHAAGKRAGDDSSKAKIKEYIYALCFGREVGYAKKIANEAGLGSLFKCPFIASYVAKRDEFVKKLLDGQTITDAWGSEYSIAAPEDGDEATGAKSSAARKKICNQIMAKVCQSHELALLMPVFEYADANELEVVALLHDGIFCLGDWGPHIEAVQSLVNERAQALLGVDMPITVDPPKVIDVVAPAAAAA